MSDIRYTRSYERFQEFLTNLENSKSDKDLLMAGHRLLNSWMGYGSATNASCGERAIDAIVEERNNKKQK